MPAPASQPPVRLVLDTSDPRPPVKLEYAQTQQVAPIPLPHELKVHPTHPGGENALLTFVGTATTLIEWRGLRLMTDPNFLNAADTVHLIPGVKSKRLTNPSLPLNQVPPVHFILLSHYHEDHFDKLVEDRLRRHIPIITNSHAERHLTTSQYKHDPYTAVTALATWQTANITAGEAALDITAMPAKHVRPGVREIINNVLHVLPPTNGWMLELKGDPPYRIYITGGTIMYEDLHDIPDKYPHIDLMLLYLGGTSLPDPKLPLLTTTMDANRGIALMNMVKPDVTIPIHYDDYDAFRSPLEDFQHKVMHAGLEDRVVYLSRGGQYSFKV
ncbi:Metallo-hydrolase/oxidoreductase [Epithele typhae]|uniref:Metallo-hydrolase/oxidoreductase n=1 Tax=Epithele typhae TaxID=378194 RepID=UPI0020073484|nr:Metallo-hydrolase/oxidoreductase [Epithele typhae]KAH9927436.1 Metallo-hydrolase/oxidoreductase [Epithele typhae]